jgi:hypothetical protein
MTNENEQLEILVLEDKYGKIAMEALAKAGVKPKIVENLEEFMKEVENPNYAGAILDLNFPRKQGEKAELLGYEAGKIAEQHGLPRVYLTGGYFHHTTELAKIFLDEEISGGNAPAKDKPEAWKMAYEKLPPAEIMRAAVAAKKRYMRATGKAYKAK